MTNKQNKEMVKKAEKRQKEILKEKEVAKKKNLNFLGISIFLVFMIPVSLLGIYAIKAELIDFFFPAELVVTLIWGMIIFFIFLPKEMNRLEKESIKNIEFEQNELFSIADKLPVESIRKDDDIKQLEKNSRMFASLDRNQNIMISLVSRKDSSTTIYEVLEKGSLLKNYKVKNK